VFTKKVQKQNTITIKEKDLFVFIITLSKKLNYNFRSYFSGLLSLIKLGLNVFLKQENLLLLTANI
jgi:hypothetical protein